MPGTVKSGLLPDTDRSHKCDCQDIVCWWMRHLLLDKGHFIIALRSDDKPVTDRSYLAAILFHENISSEAFITSINPIINKIRPTHAIF